MATESQLQSDLAAAMKARAADELGVLRGLLAAIKNVKVERRVGELSEAEIAAVVRKEIHKRQEAMEYARRGGREELVRENQRQKEILERYLPRQLDRSELERVIRALAEELGTSKIGPIMAKLQERYPGQFDGRVASEIIRGLS